jgi:hypothetical protein
VSARAGAALGMVDRKLTHRALRLVAFAFHPAGPTRLRADHAWVEWSELERAGMPTAMKAVAALAFSRRVV